MAGFDFLGSIGTGAKTFMDWSIGSSDVRGIFRGGPEMLVDYTFHVFPRSQGTNLGRFISPLVRIDPAIIVTDDELSDIDLANGQDVDAANDRKLVVK